MEAHNTGSNNSTTESDESTEKHTGRNEFSIKTYDLEVRAESESCGIDELAEICSDEIQAAQKFAMFGELQELERKDLFSELFGGD